jgi:hypothetical protein
MLGILIFLFLLLNPSHVSQEPRSNFYISTQQAFSLEKLADRQKFLLDESVRNLNRDAVAGVVDEGFNFYSFVIIAPSAQRVVGDFARQMLDELPVKNKQILSFKEVKIQGLPGCHLAFTGSLDGQVVSYEVNLIAYKTLIYQLVSFQIGQKTPTLPAITALMPKFRILKNQEPSLLHEVRGSKAFGQVWYENSDTYFHLGFRFKAPLNLSGYRYLTGEKAKSIHPDAFLAWVSKNESRSLYLLGSRDYVSIKDYLAQWKASFAKKENLRQLPDSARGGAIFILQKKPFSIRYRIRILKQDNLQVLMVLSSRVEDPAAFPSRLLLQARWLTLTELQRRTKILRSLSRQTTLLTRNQAFNHNIYRNYKYGVRWVMDPQDLCELGFQDETNLGTEYEIYLENHSKGYRATLELERDQLLSSLAYHKDILNQWQEVQAVSTQEKRGFYSSEFKIKNQPSFYVLITSKLRESYLKILFWSQRSLNVQALVNGIHWDSLPPLQMAPDRVISDRMAFVWRRENGDKIRAVTPYEVEPIGEVFEIQTTKGKQFLYCINSHFMDEELLLDLFLNSQPSSLILQFLGSDSSELLGLKALEREYSFRFGDKPRRLLQKTLRRGSTIFSSFSMSAPEDAKNNGLQNLENYAWGQWK